MRGPVPYLAFLAAALAPAVLAAPRPNPAPFVPGQASAYSSDDAAPLHTQETHPVIDGSYMVILKDDVSTTEFLAHRSMISAAQVSANSFHGSSDSDGIGHIYELTEHLQGYAGKFTPDVVDYIRSLPEVAYVERDSVVKTMEMPDDGSMVWESPYQTTGLQVGDVSTSQFDHPAVEKGAPWGLARVSHRKELGLGTFSKYLYDSDAGEGVSAYIIDTGININHVEFEGRARWGKTMPTGSTDKDGNGHGTHCAGTVISRKYGVSKKAEAVAVKVLSDSGSGSMSDVTGGVLWAVADAKKQSAAMAANPNSARAKKHRGFVANMSLGGGKSPTLDRAVDGATKSGLAFAVAAGNENQDACNVSPAGAPGPVTVGASTIQDERAYFSNKGKCVDVFGPGLNILSTWNSGNTSTNTISGTSMASPHVCGILAYYLSETAGNSTAAIKAAAPSFASAASILRYLPFQESLGWVAVSASRYLFGMDASDAASTFMSRFAPGFEIATMTSPDSLKLLIEKAATKGALRGLDTDTTNLLVYNKGEESQKKE
ncbi:unnamed protein product [Jaminaea pallidilutea]